MQWGGGGGGGGTSLIEVCLPENIHVNLASQGNYSTTKFIPYQI